MHSQASRVPTYLMPNEGRSWSGANIDHEKTAYLLVASALGLDAQNCWKKGLRLLVGFEGPPCIGLAAFNQKYADEKVDSDQRIILCMGRWVNLQDIHCWK